MIVVVLAALALGSPAAQAALIPTPSAGPPIGSVPAVSDTDKITCRRTAVTGSRLGGDKVCLTKAQWAEQQRFDGDILREVQTRASQLRPR